jgi:hypothetical protein
MNRTHGRQKGRQARQKRQSHTRNVESFFSLFDGLPTSNRTFFQTVRWSGPTLTLHGTSDFAFGAVDIGFLDQHQHHDEDPEILSQSIIWNSLLQHARLRLVRCASLASRSLIGPRHNGYDTEHLGKSCQHGELLRPVCPRGKSC